MIALKVLPVVQVLLILFTDLILSYPSSVYNTKHFRQSSHRPVYDPYNYYYTRTQRYPYEYYPSYSQMYPDEYYYNLQDTYPTYYISPRSSKYDLYQTALPYYQDVTRSKYYNYGDTSYDDPEKVLQDIEREQRERSQPIGHEIRYEDAYNSDSDGTLDDTSAAFLNNLMMQQMYQDNLRGKNSPYYEQTDYPTDFNNPDNDDIKVNKWNDVPYDRPVHFEDEEVKELQELPKKQKQGRRNRQRKQRKLKTTEKRSEDDVVVFTDRKPVIKEMVTSSTDLPGDETRRNTRGQKEEVMMRPATPVRHPFSESVLDMLNQQEERKRSPSVYDKIRHILEMEKNEENLDETKPEDEIRPLMKKRIVSSEDSLTRQLSVLKKVQ